MTQVFALVSHLFNSCKSPKKTYVRANSHQYPCGQVRRQTLDLWTSTTPGPCGKVQARTLVEKCAQTPVGKVCADPCGQVQAQTPVEICLPDDPAPKPLVPLHWEPYYRSYINACVFVLKTYGHALVSNSFSGLHQ